MTNTRQDLLLPTKFNFNNANYFYYRVHLDYDKKNLRSVLNINKSKSWRFIDTDKIL